MKFMSGLQCLMGGNVMQVQDSSPVSATTSLEYPTRDKADKRANVTNKRKKKKAIMVLKPDGDINVYNKPIMVSEITKTDDEYMVCRSDSFYIGQKIQSLSPDDRLLPGHTYFLLPAHLLHSVLSFVTIAAFTASSMKHQEDVKMDVKAAFLKKAAASSCSPFNIEKTSSGALRIQVSEGFISQLMMDQATTSNRSADVELLANRLLCTTPELHREYKQLVVGSRRSWKPKLEMIKETHAAKGKRKVKMLLFASINSMKKRMKNKSDTPMSSFSSASSSSYSSSHKKKNKKMKKKIKKTKIVKSTYQTSFIKSNRYT